MTRALLLLPLAALLLTACGEDDAAPRAAAPAPDLSVPFVDPDGVEKGTVALTFAADGTTTVRVAASGLPQGLHGFHVHAVGRCEPDSPDPAKPGTTGDFLSAGGHVAQEGQTHGDHDGDLPSLLVGADGSAELVTTTDRLSREDVLDDDGSAVMVHAAADNFANLPDRYSPAPDETTLKTGDAGARIACAVLEG